MKKWVSTSLLFFLLLPELTTALPSDAYDIFHIQADHIRFDFKNGENLYQGHVKAHQGSTYLLADRLLTERDPHHKMKKITAYGSFLHRAHYWTIPHINELTLNAKADIIIYYPQEKLITLLGHASVTQGNTHFDGKKINYNVDTKTIESDSSTTRQTTIILKPSEIS